MERKYIKYVHKPELYGGVDTYPSLQRPLDELSNSLIPATLKEIKCCWNDINTYNSSNISHKQYIDLLKSNYNKFMTSVNDLQKPDNYQVIFDINKMDTVRDDIRRKNLNIMKFITNEYYKFMETFISALKNANLPNYQLSTEYKRSQICETADQKSCCDTLMLANSCTFLFSQKLMRFLLPLKDFKTNLEKIIPNFNLNIKAELIVLKEIINENIDYLDNKIKSIDEIKTELDQYTSTFTVTECKDLMKRINEEKYGNITIPKEEVKQKKKKFFFF